MPLQQSKRGAMLTFVVLVICLPLISALAGSPLKLRGDFPTYFSGVQHPTPHNPSTKTIKRVCLCGGWATHGAIFEYQDGTREGMLLGNDANVIMPHSDESIAERGGEWVEIDELDGCITTIEGNQLNDAAKPRYLCHSISVKFASGKEIKYQPTQSPEWKGTRFAVSLLTKQQFYLNKLKFRDGNFTGFEGYRTVTTYNSFGFPRKSQVGYDVLVMFFDESQNQDRKKMFWMILLSLLELCCYTGA